MRLEKDQEFDQVLSPLHKDQTDLPEFPWLLLKGRSKALELLYLTLLTDYMKQASVASNKTK